VPVLNAHPINTGPFLSLVGEGGGVGRVEICVDQDHAGVVVASVLYRETNTLKGKAD